MLHRQTDTPPGTVILVDGTREHLETGGLDIKNRISLFQERLEGNVEAIPADTGGYLLVSGEGKLRELPQNHEASRQVVKFLSMDEYVAGAAIYVTRADLEEKSLRKQLSTAKTNVVVLLIDRDDEIETGNISPAFQRLSVQQLRG